MEEDKILEEELEVCNFYENPPEDTMAARMLCCVVCPGYSNTCRMYTPRNEPEYSRN